MASVCTFVFALAILCFVNASHPILLDNRNSVTSLQKYSLPQTAQDVIRSDELHLLDTVLLASIDGRFHALNRTTGRLIWNMDIPLSAPMSLESLVRTRHAGLRAGDTADSEELGTSFETYIIEPQSGNIFMIPSDSKVDEPLQRMSFSMAQLVDMSPFRFDDERTFVGKKRTSLISLDLRSGEVLEILDPEQCSWGDEQNPVASRWRQVLSKEEELLDELGPPERTIVHIGRTDYHVSVFSKGRVIQNLTYSAYGPNNMDKDLQSMWRATPDNRYYQPTPDGHILMFKTDEHDPLTRVYHKFKQPIVAVFDTATLSERQDPLLLMQPTPPLEKLYPSRLKDLSDLEENKGLTFVGRIGDSLYALSQENYPHVLWARKRSPRRTIDGESSPYSGVTDIDEYGDPLDTCISLDCLRGAHHTESANPSKLSKLIASSPAMPPSYSSSAKEIQIEARPGIEIDTELPQPSSVASSSSPPVSGATPRRSTVPLISMDPPPSSVGFWTIGPQLKIPLWTGLAGLILLFWALAKQVKVRWGVQSELTAVANRGVGFEPVVLPPLKLEQKSAVTPSSNAIGATASQVHTRAPSVGSVAKPLPPVPSPDAPLQDDRSVSPEVERRSVDEDADGAETEKDTPDNGSAKRGAKKPTRRKRGKGGGGGKKVVLLDPLGRDADADIPRVVFTHTAAQASPIAPVIKSSSSLEVSDTVLGYGSHGTMVFQGTFQGRAVAVKRLLQDFVTLAAREVTLLQESDDHPNVIRYYFKENRENFLYIALELCPASLADIIERPHLHPEISASFDPKRALGQVTQGLRHLHSLKIIHRDIKPQNILISRPASSGGTKGQHRMLISDFGLCRKLESDQTSFLPTVHSGGMAAGTVGWRAPEILRGEVKLDESTLDMSSGGTPNSSVGGTDSGEASRNGTYNQNRLTKAVDVFALGCLFYYTLTGAEHPYGERFEREVNIIKDNKNLDRLIPLGEDGMEVEDLIVNMLANDPKQRPDTTACLLHPFFWIPGRRLGFLQDASDRFEIMGRDPPEPQLVALETNAREVVGLDWHKKLDRVFDDNLGKYRKYDGKSVQDLMRALRNKKHHYQDLPDNVKRSLGSLPDGFLAYFTRRFPKFFLHIYHVVSKDPLLRQDAMFRTYFQLLD